MFTRPTRIAIACAGIFASIGSLHAFAANEELNPVVVSATKSEQLLSDVLLSVSVISRKDIDKNQSADLMDILRSEPGLEIIRTGVLGSATSVYLRGGNSNQTLILLDGVPFSGESASGAAAPIEMIPVSQIEKIEILRGNASALYGSGAIGGVINIVTRDGAGSPKGSVDVTYGSRNTKNVIAAYSGEIDNTKFYVSASSLNTGGYNSISPASFSDVNQSPNGYRNNSAKLNLSKNFGEGLTLGVNYVDTNSWTSLDGTMSHLDQDYSNRQLQSDVFYFKKIINDQWITQMNFSQSTSKSNTYYNDYYSYLGAYYPTNSWSNSQDSHQKLSWKNNYDISPNNKFVFGYENEKLRGQSDVSWAGAVDAHRTINSAYIGHYGLWSTISTQLNIRYDAIQSGDSKVTWLAGGGYPINQNWKVTATKSTAFNAPTSGQLSDISQGGNLNLKSEKSNSWEFGPQYKDERNLLKLIYFKTNYKDLIVPGTVNVSPCPFSYCGTYLVNADSAKNDGIELTLRTIQSFGVIKASYTNQNPINNSTGALLLNRAREYGSLEYSTGSGMLEWGGKVSASGYRYTPDAYSGVTTKTAGYAVYSSFISYQLEKDWYLKASVENLLDKKYYQVSGYNAAPQMFFLTVSYRPN